MNLIGDQAKGLRSLLGRGGLRVALFVSGTRRTGQTTAVANLALAGARFGRNVMLIEETQGASSAAACFGVRGRYDLVDAIRGRRRIEDVIVRGPDGLMILHTGRAFHMKDKAYVSAAPWGLAKAFENIVDELDWLLIDAAAGFDTRLLPLSLSAHETVVVMPEHRQGLTGSYAMMKLLCREFGLSRFRVLATRTRDAGRAQLGFQRVRSVARRHLDARVDWLGSVPFDGDVKRASAMARPLITAFPYSPAAQAIRSGAEDLLGSPVGIAEENPVGILLKRLVEGGRIDFAAKAMA